MKNPQVLIINFGSQYTDLIALRLRELGVRSAILPPGRAEPWISNNKPRAIILSGSYASVNDEDAPTPPDVIFSLGVPILGICYGVQELAVKFGGEVRSGTGEGNLGKTVIIFSAGKEDGGLWDGIHGKEGNLHTVWASHGDLVTRVPEGFTQIAWPYSQEGIGVMGMADLRRRIWGVQFHPEVTHTDQGERMLANFVFRIAGCERDWSPADIAGEIREDTLREINGRDVLMGVSGGVDSTVVAKLLVPALGDRLHAIVIDAGNLRENELEAEILPNIRSAGIGNLRIIRKPELFVSGISRTVDAQEKRRAFSAIYFSIFDSVARHLGSPVVVQGTNAADINESGARDGAEIVAHHNLGRGMRHGIHPLRHLFKHEIRALAKAIGLPPEVYNRQPFPGPGLFARIVGAPVTFARLVLIRWADERVTKLAKETGDYEKTSQLLAGLLCVNVGGVKGDARSYAPIIGVRGIVTPDFMTGRGYKFPEATRDRMIRMLTKHPGIGDVMFSEADKPPRRTEFE